MAKRRKKRGTGQGRSSPSASVKPALSVSAETTAAIPPLRQQIGALLTSGLVVVAVLGAIAYFTWQPEGAPRSLPQSDTRAPARAEYVGATACGQCHASELKA